MMMTMAPHGLSHGMNVSEKWPYVARDTCPEGANDIYACPTYTKQQWLFIQFHLFFSEPLNCILVPPTHPRLYIAFICTPGLGMSYRHGRFFLALGYENMYACSGLYLVVALVLVGTAQSLFTSFVYPPLCVSFAFEYASTNSLYFPVPSCRYYGF